LEVDVIEQRRVHVLLADPHRLSAADLADYAQLWAKYHAEGWSWESAVSYLKLATAGRRRAWVCHF
jgi:hypothetical protein